MSTTLITCVARALLPAKSVAVKVRVIIKGLLAEPSPPLLDSVTVTITPLQLSVATTLTVLAGGTSLLHWNVADGGTLRKTGGVLSATVMTNRDRIGDRWQRASRCDRVRTRLWDVEDDIVRARIRVGIHNGLSQ